MESPNWGEFEARYDHRLIEVLTLQFSTPGPLEITALFLLEQTGVPEEQCARILEEIATSGLLLKTDGLVCAQCGKLLTKEEAQGESCPHCDCLFDEKQPVIIRRFIREAPRARDVIWMLTLHGMNTRGAWQEDFNWLVSKTYKRMVPVAIYKYGLVRPGAVLKSRQRALTRGLIGRIRRLSGETRTSGFGGMPDVIAHSFGTWLLGHALRTDCSLRVGRVILTGCILRPDFNWKELIDRNQVQAVLCHVATNDAWSRIAHYVIPDSGPSGRRGFNDRLNIQHAVLSGGSHSDFFREALMPGLFAGTWQPFLNGQTNHSALTVPETKWAQAWWPLRATIIRCLLLAIAGVLVLLTIAALAFGAIKLWRLV